MRGYKYVGVTYVRDRDSSRGRVKIIFMYPNGHKNQKPMAKIRRGQRCGRISCVSEKIRQTRLKLTKEKIELMFQRPIWAGYKMISVEYSQSRKRTVLIHECPLGHVTTTLTTTLTNNAFRLNNQCGNLICVMKKQLAGNTFTPPNYYSNIFHNVNQKLTQQTLKKCFVFLYPFT